MGLLDFGLSNIDLWRSEEMQLVQLMIPAESAHDTVAAIGELGVLQFRDLNGDKSAFQRTYANQVRRCDEMARKLRFFSEQVEKSGLHVTIGASGSSSLDMDELEAKLEDLEGDVIDLNTNGERLERSYNELLELQLLLEKASPFFESGATLGMEHALASTSTADAPSLGAPLLEAAQVDVKGSKLGFVAGMIQREKIISFERLLFRVTRGNMFLRHTEVGKVKDPATCEPQEKTVFVVFFTGDRAKAKIQKVCEAFGANRYPFPEEVPRQRQMYAEVTVRLKELGETLEAGRKQRDSVLQSVAAQMDSWNTLVRREKGVYHTLNKLSVDVTSKVLIAEAWVPSAARMRVHETLQNVAMTSSTRIGSVVQPMVTNDLPPTHFQTNKFTSCFQTIVDAYGVARYREVNPTVYTIMTFPFLFAVMFGDLGHGILMLMFALLLVLNEKKMGKQDLGDMVGMLFGGRYCILLMAIFSIYTGLIYNEFFSMPMTIFGSTQFSCKTQPELKDLRDCLGVGNIVWPEHAQPYALGVDPVWHGTKTELPFLNSLKMKMSILLGVIHMNLGIFMSFFNNIYHRDILSNLCEFVPQVLFLNCLFGYLSLLIVYKWFSGGIADLYHVMIYMFLSPGSMDDQGRLFDGQGGLQVVLVLIALVTVPWMLFPKPFILKKRHEAQRVEFQALQDEESSAIPHADHGHGEHFEFGEVIVHQMIHTIEFVLGAVSNTASYLRLWALSLAHSQLSAVFYDRVLMMTITMDSPVAMFIGFAVFACATLGVLMVMESLSAFLHALRLHWVEYMNKFYRGDGYLFVPFSFDAKASSE